MKNPTQLPEMTICTKMIKQNFPIIFNFIEKPAHVSTRIYLLFEILFLMFS